MEDEDDNGKFSREIEEYKDISANMRHQANMQFAQLTIFGAAAIIIFGQVLSEPCSSELVSISLLIFVALLGGLFLGMSARVSVYWDALCQRAKELEPSLGYYQYLRPPKKGLVSNRTAVSAVYLATSALAIILVLQTCDCEDVKPKAEKIESAESVFTLKISREIKL